MTYSGAPPAGEDSSADSVTARRKVLSAAVEWQLLVSVHSQTTSLVIGGVAQAAAAVVGWMLTGERLFLVWACAAGLALIGRLMIDRTFRARHEGSADFRPWRRRFILGAWAMSALWGIGAVPITLSFASGDLRLLLISLLIVLVMGTTSRSAACPAAVQGQIFLSLGPVFVALVLKGDREHLVLSVFILLFIASTLVMLHHLYDQTVGVISANEANVTLVTTVRQVNSELSAANLQLEKIAITDALTGIGNRRRFDDVLIAETRRARRESAELALLMIDIDLFKGYNDLYGHQAGDVCLRRVAGALSGALRRPGDSVARYGGEEFGVILPQTGTAAAAALAEKVRSDVEKLGIHSAANRTGVITVSIGVSTLGSWGAEGPQDCLHAADEALYAAKADGRNRVCIAPAAKLPAAGPGLARSAPPSGTVK